MLNGTLALHDVRDIERLADKALTDALRTMRATLPPQEREDALAYLIATAWEASLTYQPTRSPSFSQYAYRRCKLRTIDWFRQRYVDTRAPKPPPPLSIDHELELARTNHEHPRGRGPLEQALTTSQDDPQQRSHPDLTRVLRDRSGEHAWRREVASKALDHRTA